MVLKTEISNLVKRFNAKNKSAKARLIDSDVKSARILFTIKDGLDKKHCFEEFSNLMTHLTGKNVICAVERDDDKATEATFTLGDESPADKILKILLEYSEGTPPVNDFEDD
jgi:hypothetical protein